MMTHDPFQNNYQTQGAYPGVTTPFGLPYTAFQPSYNPYNPMGVVGQPPAAGQNPILQNPLWQHPQAQVPWQNPVLAAGPQNPLHNPMLSYYGWPQQQQQFGYPLAPQSLIGPGGIGQPFGYGWPQQQQQFGYPPAPQSLMGPGGIGQPSGYGWPQQQQQFGYPPAPQSLMGPGGVGQPFSQIHPLAQMALRQAAGYGLSPLAGSF